MNIAVVGGGIAGSFTTYNLLKEGHAVTMIDNDIKNVKTSFYNGGSISLSASFTSVGLSRIVSAYLGRRGPVYVSLREMMRNPRWFRKALRAGPGGYEEGMTALSIRGMELFRHFLGNENPDISVVKGALKLYKKMEDAERKAKEISGRLVDAKEAAEMGFKGFEGGVFFDKISVYPQELCEYFRGRIEQLGGRVVLGSEVHLKKTDSKVESPTVTDSAGRVDAYVLAAGAWSNELCRPLGYDPHILPARGLAMIFSTERKKACDHVAEFEDEGVAVTPHDEDTLRIVSFFELVGYNPTFDEKRKEWMLKSAKAHMARSVNLTLKEEGVGFRPCAPDQLPVIGRIPGCDNAYIASGGCRKGLTMAPVAAQLISAAIAGREDNLMALVNPSRFA